MKTLSDLLSDIHGKLERFFEEYGQYRGAKKILKDYNKSAHPYNFDDLGREMLPEEVIDAQLIVKLWKNRY